MNRETSKARRLWVKFRAGGFSINQILREKWGTVYGQDQDLARIDMKVEKTPAPVEQFVISLAPAGKGGVLRLEWENTSASVNFTEKK